MRATTTTIALTVTRTLARTPKHLSSPPTRRSFALTADVGQGRSTRTRTPHRKPSAAAAATTNKNISNSNSKSNSSSNTTVVSPYNVERTPEQTKAARVEYERMVRATKRILEQQQTETPTTPLTPASTQKLRVIFHYWTSGKSNAVFVAEPTSNNNNNASALEYAEMLLEWIMREAKTSDQHHPQLLYTIFKTDDCSGGALINMMEQYLLPFRSTHQSLKTAVASRRLRSQKSVDELKSALLNATRLMDRLERLLDDPNYPDLVHDTFISNMMLNIWVKRTWFRAQHGSDALVDKDFVRIALKGMSSVEECLEAMQTCADSLLSPDWSSTTSLLLAAWANSGLPNRAEQAHALLLRAEQESPPNVALNSVAYNTVMSAYASLSKDDVRNADRAQDLLDYMHKYGKECDVATYSSLLFAYANAGYADRAIELLTQMESDFSETIGTTTTTKLYPNTICYNIVLDALAKIGTEEAALRAEALLRRMQAMSDEGGLNSTCAPDTVSFTSVIQAWERSSSPDAAEKAEALLLQCRERSAKDRRLAPDVVMYNMVLHTWATHKQRQSSTPPSPTSPPPHLHQQKEQTKKRLRQGPMNDVGARGAESLLRRMKDSDEVRPDTVSYNIIMNAWSNSGNNRAAALRARELLEEMKKRYRAGDDDVKPDVITYNTVIKLVSRSGIPGCFHTAQCLLNEMQLKGYMANTITYNTVMSSLVRSGDAKAVEKAEDMLDEMERLCRDGNKSVCPGEITFNIVLHAYAKSKDPRDAKKAEKLLTRMLEISQRGAGRGSGSIRSRRGIEPSIKTFATVLDAYANSGQAEAAESLFDRMATSGIVKVNTITYNTVLNALSKSKDRDAPYRAEALLNRMQHEYEAGNKDVQPNSISFSSLLNSWAKSDIEGAAKRAETILTRMEELAARGNSHVAPNAVAYSTVLNAWSRSGASDAAERALGILARMEDAYHNGQEHAKPNAYCYNAAMNAVAKSNAPDKAAKSYEILHRMIDAYKNGNDTARPSVTSYSTVLNACGYSSGSDELKREAFRIARKTFAEFLESDYGEPNAVTYVNFMNACSALLPEGPVRDNMMAAVFRECYLGDLVNDKIMGILRRSVPPGFYSEVIAMVKNKS